MMIMNIISYVWNVERLYMYEDSDELEELLGSDEDEQTRDEVETGLRLSNDTVVECGHCGSNIVVPALLIGSFQCPYCFGVVLI
jgi:hypothetical protein